MKLSSILAFFAITLLSAVSGEYRLLQFQDFPGCQNEADAAKACLKTALAEGTPSDDVLQCSTCFQDEQTEKGEFSCKLFIEAACDVVNN